MLENQPQWVVISVAFVTGMVVMALLMWAARKGGVEGQLRKELEQTQTALKDYQALVDQHFATTADLFRDVTERAYQQSGSSTPAYSPVRGMIYASVCAVSSVIKSSKTIYRIFGRFAMIASPSSEVVVFQSSGRKLKCHILVVELGPTRAIGG